MALQQSKADPGQFASEKFTYGETNLSSLRTIFDAVKGYEGGREAMQQVFVDLGSGVGKAVIAAAIDCEFQEVRGIELMPGLHQEVSPAPNLSPRAVSPLPLWLTLFPHVSSS